MTTRVFADDLTDFSAERLGEMLEVVAAEMKRRPPPSVEQHAMLDLARICDLVATFREDE